MTSLTEYRSKRDFRKTPEPKGDEQPPADRPIYTVQKHDASRPHYDFRLEVDGALASWAVPKGPSLNPSDKRLAVRTEDHPLDYHDFEGIIPKGEYGGGTVMLWDHGSWTPHDDDPADALKNGKLSFTLRGDRLAGGFTLTRSPSVGPKGDDNWLLIKHDDDHASRAKKQPTDKHTTSVKTRRSLEGIARHDDPAEPELPDDPADLEHAARRTLPATFTPQLATLADKAPAGDDWVHEIKFDGYRLLARIDARRTKLLTRNAKDWTDRFPPIADATRELDAEHALIDGEACILTKAGRTSFQQLRQAIKHQRFDGLVFFVFDLLHLDGVDLTSVPLLQRKELLRTLVPSTDSGVLRYSEHVVGGGPDVHKNACKLGLEGVISKRVDAPYSRTRSRSWLKVKCARRQEFLLIGYTPPSGSRKHMGAVLTAAHNSDGELVYTGRVGAGFTHDDLRDVKRRLDDLRTESCPADDCPDTADAKHATWAKPKLVAEVQFTEWTDDGRLRHPSFQGLRSDKPPKDVRIEKPRAVADITEAMPARGSKPSSSSSKQSRTKKKRPNRRSSASTKTTSRREPDGDTPAVAGVAISSSDRVVFPDADLTKLDLARYYESVADRILPFIERRPLSTVRCPQGRAKKCFFQKHLGDTLPEPVEPIRVSEKSSAADYISVSSVEALVTLIQFGVIELHPWGSRAGDLERPDQLTFDLDPSDGVHWSDLTDAARRVRDLLEQLGLRSFLKATGGKGLHVVVPLVPEAPWDRAKSFCRDVASLLVRQQPDKYLATASKSKRRGKIFIDYLRNGRGSTSVAPYAARARPGAPVAAPLRWDELSRVGSAQKYTVANIHRRLARLDDDPWDGYHRTRQRLTAARIDDAHNRDA